MEATYKSILVNRIMECIELSVTSDKLSNVKTLIDRHAEDLDQSIKNVSDIDVIKGKFSNFINRTLSTIEALGLVESQYKAIRKLILTEINGCLDMIMKVYESKSEA